MITQHLRSDQPAIYRIIIQGHLPDEWTVYFNGLAIVIDQFEDVLSTTTLTGCVRDQAELHGILMRIRDIGLILLMVQCVKNNCTENSVE